MYDPLVDTIEFRVIGELKSDPGHLLLSGDDGRWYDYDISHGTIIPVEPSDSWAVDLIDDTGQVFTVPAPRVA
jgi:hypothetical protein